MLYFAYGMNLKPEWMSGMYDGEGESCVQIGPAVLDGYRLDFRYYADVQPHEGAAVPGGLWDISAEVLRDLDGREGYPHFYTRLELSTSGGTAWVYTMADPGMLVSPSEGYFKTVMDGYEAFGLDLDPLLMAAGRASVAEHLREGEAWEL